MSGDPPGSGPSRSNFDLTVDLIKQYDREAETHDWCMHPGCGRPRRPAGERGRPPRYCEDHSAQTRQRALRAAYRAAGRLDELGVEPPEGVGFRAPTGVAAAATSLGNLGVPEPVLRLLSQRSGLPVAGLGGGDAGAYRESFGPVRRRIPQAESRSGSQPDDEPPGASTRTGEGSDEHRAGWGRGSGTDTGAGPGSGADRRAPGAGPEASEQPGAAPTVDARHQRSSEAEAWGGASSPGSGAPVTGSDPGTTGPVAGAEAPGPAPDEDAAMLGGVAEAREPHGPAGSSLDAVSGSTRVPIPEPSPWAQAVLGGPRWWRAAWSGKGGSGDTGAGESWRSWDGEPGDAGLAKAVAVLDSLAGYVGRGDDVPLSPVNRLLGRATGEAGPLPRAGGVTPQPQRASGPPGPWAEVSVPRPGAAERGFVFEGPGRPGAVPDPGVPSVVGDPSARRALESARRALQEQERSLPPGTDPAVRLSLLEALVDLGEELGDVPSAMASMTRLLDLQRQVLGPDDPATVGTALRLARVARRPPSR